jgi:hypothetical protein
MGAEMTTRRIAYGRVTLEYVDGVAYRIEQPPGDGIRDCILAERRGHGAEEGVHMTTDRQTTTIDHVPKVLDARGHAVMDYQTAGAFLALGMVFRHRHRRASGLAFVHGASVLAASLMTDYPGGVWRRFSFRTHRTLDIMQAGLIALGPAVLGFAADPEAQAFHGQALFEAGVIAATDWTTP